MEIQNQQKPSSSLRSKLLTVGVSGVVFVGGTLGLSSLASAQTGSEPVGSAESAVVEDGADVETHAAEGVEIDGEHHGVSFFDGMSDADQAVILEFEECLGDAGLIEEMELEDLGDLEELTDEELENLGAEVQVFELTDEEFAEIDAAFADCEPILDDLSFDADEWLGGDAEMIDVEMIDGEHFEGCVLVDVVDGDELDLDLDNSDFDAAQLEELVEAEEVATP